jgi:hypothetical protein
MYGVATHDVWRMQDSLAMSQAFADMRPSVT